MTKKVIIHENRKFDWTVDELSNIQVLWFKGKSPSEIAQLTKSDVMDIALVLLHLYSDNEIELGVGGNEQQQNKRYIATF